jgi:hypothetical protein
MEKITKYILSPQFSPPIACSGNPKPQMNADKRRFLCKYYAAITSDAIYWNLKCMIKSHHLKLLHLNNKIPRADIQTGAK